MEAPKNIADRMQAILARKSENPSAFSTKSLIERQVESFNAENGRRTNFYCEECKNKGFVAFVSQNGDFCVRECECEAKRRLISKAEKSGLMDKFKIQKLENFKADEEWQEFIKQKAEDFLKSDLTKWFFIGGQSGCGKTFICTAICRELLLQKGFDVKYFVWSEEVPKIKAVANEFEQYAEKVDKLKTVKVLYIDDLFKARDISAITPADVRLAFEILNYRYGKEDLITIISSEQSTGRLSEIDEATAGRIVEKCGTFIINVKPDRAKNYRFSKRSAENEN